MDLTDLTAVEKTIFTVHNPRRGRPILCFYLALMQHGYEFIKNSAIYSRSTFYKRITDLVELGFSRSQLQQLNGTSESRIEAGVVIPMIRVLELSRMDELPAWFTPTPADWSPFDPGARRAVGQSHGPMPHRVPKPAPVFAMPEDAEIFEFLRPGAPTIPVPEPHMATVTSLHMYQTNLVF